MISERVHLLWFKYLSVILDPLCLFAMDGALYASMHVLDVDDCSMPCVCENAMPCVCENASMSVYIDRKSVV